MSHAFSAPSGLVVALGMSLAAALGADAASPAPTRLAYSAKKDDVLRCRFALTVALDIESPMGPMQVEFSQEQYLAFRVLGVDEKGTLHLATTIERLRGRVEIPMMAQETQFDTDEKAPAGGDGAAPAPAGDPMVRFARALKGGKFEVWLTPQGKVSKVEGATKLAAAARKKSGEGDGGGVEGEPFGGGGMSVGTLGDPFSDRGIAQLLELALPRMAEPAVDVGDSWKSPGRFEVPMIGHDLKIDVTLVVEKFEGTVAHLLAAGSAQGARRAAPAPKEGEGGDAAGPMDDLMKNAKFEVSKSSVDGTVRFDAGKGWLEESAITAKVTASLEAKLPGMDGMGGEGEDEAPALKFDAKGTVRVSTKLLSLTHGTGGEGF